MEEAKIIGRYHLAQPPDQGSIELYVRAINTLNESYSIRDEKILRFALKHPRLLGVLDAGLAFEQPGSELRRRIYIMFTVLETQPQYAHLFLSKQTHLYVFSIPYLVFNACIKSIIGMIVLRWIK